MSGPKYSSAAIREVWEKEGKQRWDGRAHGRGIGLLIVDALAAQGTLILGRLRAPSRTFEFWRDQNKIRGRFIGLGNGVVVARLDKDELHPRATERAGAEFAQTILNKLGLTRSLRR